jgi:hypothetical protein
MFYQKKILHFKKQEKIVKLKNWSLKLNELGIPKVRKKRHRTDYTSFGRLHILFQPRWDGFCRSGKNIVEVK